MSHEVGGLKMPFNNRICQIFAQQFHCKLIKNFLIPQHFILMNEQTPN